MGKMRFGLIFLCFLVALAWTLAHAEWHTKRNKHNLLPAGTLTFQEDKSYLDSSGRLWLLQSAKGSTFHQPEQQTIFQKNRYPGLDIALKFNPDYPNLKFLSEDSLGGSVEAIMQVNGTYLEVGAERGTYNYCHPGNLWGKVKHVFADLIPHLINSEYKI